MAKENTGSALLVNSLSENRINRPRFFCWIIGHVPMPRTGVVRLLESAHDVDDPPPFDFAVCARCGCIYCLNVGRM